MKNPCPKRLEHIECDNTRHDGTMKILSMLDEMLRVIDDNATVWVVWFACMVSCTLIPLFAIYTRHCETFEIPLGAAWFYVCLTYDGDYGYWLWRGGRCFETFGRRGTRLLPTLLIEETTCGIIRHWHLLK